MLSVVLLMALVVPAASVCPTTSQSTAPGPYCASSPCQNCGECYSFTTFKLYICKCPPGFSGTNCERGCGKPAVAPRSFSTRVVGGEEAIPKSFPWQVRVFPECGGSLINNMWVMTAGHCITNGMQEVEVMLGAFNLTKSDQEEPTRIRQTIPIKNVFKHPTFSLEPIKDDIALIKLVTPVQFTSAIQPVCLPRAGDTAATGDMVLVSGWGHTLNQTVREDALRQGVMPVYNQTECVRAFFDMYGKTEQGNDYITPEMVCAGYINGGVDACTGDSGGPLIRRRPEGNFVQVGVVSFGFPGDCGAPNNPGVYTRVASYVSWIESVIMQRVLS